MNCPGDKDLSFHYIDLSLLLISSSNFIAAAAVASAGRYNYASNTCDSYYYYDRYVSPTTM